jgi:hypothetical protein
MPPLPRCSSSRTAHVSVWQTMSKRVLIINVWISCCLCNLMVNLLTISLTRPPRLSAFPPKWRPPAASERRLRRNDSNRSKFIFMDDCMAYWSDWSLLQESRIGASCPWSACSRTLHLPGSSATLIHYGNPHPVAHLKLCRLFTVVVSMFHTWRQTRASASLSSGQPGLARVLSGPEGRARPPHPAEAR